MYPLRLPFIVSILMLTACAQSPGNLALDSAKLQQSSWVLESIDGQKLEIGAQKRPKLKLNEKLQARGYAGCNSFFGQLEIQGSRLRIDKMGMTLMFCPVPQQDWEDAVRGTLGEWSRAQLQGRQLRLQGTQHELLFNAREPLN